MLVFIIAYVRYELQNQVICIQFSLSLCNDYNSFKKLVVFLLFKP